MAGDLYNLFTIFCALILLWISLEIFRNSEYRRNQETERCFVFTILANALYLSLEGITFYMDETMLGPGGIINYGANGLYFAVAILPGFLWLRYVVGLCLPKLVRHPVFRVITALPHLSVALAAVLAYWNKWLFGLDENFCYQRGPGYHMMLTVMCSYTLLSLAVSVGAAFRAENGLDRERYIRFAVYSLLVVLGEGLHKFLPAYPVTSAAVFASTLLVYVCNERWMSERQTGRILELVSQLQEANEKIAEANNGLRRTLSAEEQYRQATVSGARTTFHIKVSRNLIEEEFYEIDGERRTPLIQEMGMKAPCQADEFFRRWSEEHVEPSCRERYREVLCNRHMLEAFERGEREFSVEFECRDRLGELLALRHACLLITDPATGEILCLNSSKDITEQKRQEMESRRALQDAVEEANRANSAKSDFLARMSHDIRTPINGIMGMLAIADRSMEDPEKVKECLEKIGISSRHLLALVNDVLDMSNLESGEMSFEKEPFDLSALLENCISVTRGNAAEQRITVETDLDGLRHTHLCGSALHLRQILLNILSNAVKYNREGGRIRLAVTEEASGEDRVVLCFEISDTGIGIGEAFLERIFEPFTQEDAGSRTNYMGTGLGMTIVKRLTEQMNGTIQVESRLNEGSVFRVTLPFETQSWQQEPEEAEEDDLSGRNLLVAEDNELNMEIVLFLLQDAGARVTPVRDGKEAFELFAGSEPGEYDVILMDVMMPEMDGLEATRRIRSLERADAGTIPIIAMTANAYPEDVTKAREAGMNEHLAKPLAAKTLLGAVRRWSRGSSPGTAKTNARRERAEQE